MSRASTGRSVLIVLAVAGQPVTAASANGSRVTAACLVAQHHGSASLCVRTLDRTAWDFRLSGLKPRSRWNFWPSSIPDMRFEAKADVNGTTDGPVSTSTAGPAGSLRRLWRRKGSRCAPQTRRVNGFVSSSQATRSSAELPHCVEPGASWRCDGALPLTTLAGERSVPGAAKMADSPVFTVGR